MISSLDGGLVLYKLRNPDEVRKMADVPQVERKEVNKDELKLSVSLVESMSSTLKEIDLTDRYRDALRAMIARSRSPTSSTTWTQAPASPHSAAARSKTRGR